MIASRVFYERGRAMGMEIELAPGPLGNRGKKIDCGGLAIMIVMENQELLEGEITVIKNKIRVPCNYMYSGIIVRR